MDRKPSVGTTVHYVAGNGEDNADQYPRRCRAAIITAFTDMELVGPDGTSYARNPIPNPAPELHTRWYVSLAVIGPDAALSAEHDVPGSFPDALDMWHWADECAVAHRVDWEPVSARTC